MVCGMLVVAQQQIFASVISTVDQQSQTLNTPFGNNTGGALFGQSFTPTLSGLDAVEFDFTLAGFNTTIVARVVIRDGVSGLNGLGGNIIATSNSLSITTSQNLLPTHHFDFSSTVALTPGNIYVAQLELLSGDPSVLIIPFNNSNPYGGGQALMWQNTATGLANVDFDFREGLHASAVPEPTTLGIWGGLALAGLLVARRRKRRAA